MTPIPTNMRYLENFATPFEGAHGCRIYDIKPEELDGIKARVIVITHKMIERLLLDRSIMGPERADLISSIYNDCFMGQQVICDLFENKRVIQVIPLLSGVIADCSAGFRKIPPYDRMARVPTWHLNINSHAGKTKVSGQAFPNDPKERTEKNLLFVPDPCSASGETDLEALGASTERFVDSDKMTTINEVVVAHFCGSYQAIERVAKECDESGIKKFTVIHAGGIIYTNPNPNVKKQIERDLPLCHPNTILEGDFLARAWEFHHGGKLACAVGSMNKSVFLDHGDEAEYLSTACDEFAFQGYDPTAEEFKWTLDWFKKTNGEGCKKETIEYYKRFL